MSIPTRSAIRGNPGSSGTRRSPRTSVLISTPELGSPIVVTSVPGTREHVSVAIQVQRQAGAGADVDQRDRSARGDRRCQRRQEIRAPSDLVHLIAMATAELDQTFAVVEAEAAVRIGELQG